MIMTLARCGIHGYTWLDYTILYVFMVGAGINLYFILTMIEAIIIWILRKIGILKMPYKPEVPVYPPATNITIYNVWTRLKDKERWILDTVTEKEEEAIEASQQAEALGFATITKRISATSPDIGAGS